MTFQRGDLVWVVTLPGPWVLVPRVRGVVGLARSDGCGLIVILDGKVGGQTEVANVTREHIDQSEWLADDGTVVAIERCES